MNGILLFALILYSHFPEVKLCGDARSRSVIEILKDLFWCYGLVNEIVSDSGAQFESHEFESFLHLNVIQHSRTALYHLEYNAVERFNRVLKE